MGPAPDSSRLYLERRFELEGGGPGLGRLELLGREEDELVHSFPPRQRN